MHMHGVPETRHLIATLKRALLIIALGPLPLMGLSTHAQANAKDDDLPGDWSGTCTKVATGSTWDAHMTIRHDDTFSWTSKFPATEGEPGWTVSVTGRVDRTSGHLIPQPDGRIDTYHLVDSRHMVVNPAHGMSQCSLTRY